MKASRGKVAASEAVRVLETELLKPGHPSKDPWKAIQNLVSLLCDPSHTVALQAVNLLEGLATDDSMRHERPESHKLAEALQVQAPTILAILMAGLQDPKLRTACLRTMIRFAELPNVFECVIDTVRSSNGLGSKSAFVRQETALVIPFIFHSAWVMEPGTCEQSGRLIESLIKHLRDKEPGVSTACKAALIHLRSLMSKFYASLDVVAPNGSPLALLFDQHVAGTQRRMQRRRSTETKGEEENEDENISAKPLSNSSKKAVPSSSFVDGGEDDPTLLPLSSTCPAEDAMAAILGADVVRTLTSAGTTVSASLSPAEQRARMAAVGLLVDTLDTLDSAQMAALRNETGALLEMMGDLLCDTNAKFSMRALKVSYIYLR
jgi:hypothetical protein